MKRYRIERNSRYLLHNHSNKGAIAQAGPSIAINIENLSAMSVVVHWHPIPKRATHKGHNRKKALGTSIRSWNGKSTERAKVFSSGEKLCR
ncbi:MAG: hypothetical protein V7724_02280 [Sediminicola sp.]